MILLGMTLKFAGTSVLWYGRSKQQTQPSNRCQRYRRRTHAEKFEERLAGPSPIWQFAAFLAVLAGLGFTLVGLVHYLVQHFFQ